MTDHICPSSPCPRCRDQDERDQAERDRALGAALRSPQCMECKGHGRIILGHADSEVRARGVVQCAECRFWFHTDCIIRHFATDAAKRIVDLEACIKGRDRILGDFAAKLAAHDATHERCASCGRDTENDKFGQCAYCSAPRAFKALASGEPERVVRCVGCDRVMDPACVAPVTCGDCRNIQRITAKPCDRCFGNGTVMQDSGESSAPPWKIQCPKCEGACHV